MISLGSVVLSKFRQSRERKRTNDAGNNNGKRDRPHTPGLTDVLELDQAVVVVFVVGLAEHRLGVTLVS